MKRENMMKSKGRVMREKEGGQRDFVGPHRENQERGIDRVTNQQAVG
jgi:hypothetical protein